ncbi:DinB family protein [Kitasatospora sp. NA04385]|uniref:DinB family protein n=1 Tax=Kitasatospora sp. NA04385 TaxID=2742135 RepID=UPI001590127C|nr:DinB family protein [Kitasatospora sp. NA04385]QKW23699.1 DinB family protein [Kitasatospora sp. NA04385]
MTWTLPATTRTGGSLTAPETELLPGYLAWHRATFLHKCAGLTGEQLALRPLPASSLSLLGLMRHLAKVERTWFRIRFAGQDVPPLHFVEGHKDADFDLLEPERAEQEYLALLEEQRLADLAVTGAGLDEVLAAYGEKQSLRTTYLHVITEYARHNGHADLLREHIDGVTGG